MFPSAFITASAYRDITVSLFSLFAPLCLFVCLLGYLSVFCISIYLSVYVCQDIAHSQIRFPHLQLKVYSKGTEKDEVRLTVNTVK